MIGQTVLFRANDDPMSHERRTGIITAVTYTIEADGETFIRDASAVLTAVTQPSRGRVT